MQSSISSFVQTSKLLPNEVESVGAICVQASHPLSPSFSSQPIVSWPARYIMVLCSLRPQTHQRDLIKPELRLYLIMDLYLRVATCMSLLNCERCKCVHSQTTNNSMAVSSDTKVSLVLFVQPSTESRNSFSNGEFIYLTKCAVPCDCSAKSGSWKVFLQYRY